MIVTNGRLSDDFKTERNRMTFDLSILENNHASRRPILAVMEAALAAVDPATAVTSALLVEGDRLQVGERSYDSGHF